MEQRGKKKLTPSINFSDKSLTKTSMKKRGLVYHRLLCQSPSTKKARAGAEVRELEVETLAEGIKELCLLRYSKWLAQLAFSYCTDHMPSDDITHSVLQHPTSTINQENPLPQTCSWLIWQWQFFSLCSLVSAISSLCDVYII